MNCKLFGVTISSQLMHMACLLDSLALAQHTLQGCDLTQPRQVSDLTIRWT